MCDTARKEKKCGGPPANMPAWMKCPPRIMERNYPAPSGIDILPISIGGRNGSAAPNQVKCGKCGDSANKPPAKPNASPDCPMMKARCPGKEETKESGGGFLAKIMSFFGGKGDSRLVEACRKLQAEEHLTHHRDVFDSSLIVSKDGYFYPFMTKVDCQGRDDQCNACFCEEEEEEEECEEEEEEECEEEEEEVDDGFIEIDGCKCKCECPEEEECVQDAEGECIVEESAECMDPACQFFLEDPDYECPEKKKKKCDDFSKVGVPPEDEGNCAAMRNFIIRVQAPFSECTSNETCEQILERLTKKTKTLYREPQPPEKPQEKEEVELIVKEISVEEPTPECKKPKKKCKKKEKVEECTCTKEDPPKKEECPPEEIIDEPCPCEEPPLPPSKKPEESCPPQDSCGCGQPPPPCPPPYGMFPMPGYPYPPPSGGMPYPVPPPGTMPYPMPPPPPGATPSGACPQPEGVPCPPPYPYPYPPYGMFPPPEQAQPEQTDPEPEPPIEETPPPPPQNDCETLSEEELLKKPIRDIKCGCPKPCPDNEMCRPYQMSVWTPPPPPPCPACGAEERGTTENCFLCGLTNRMRSGNVEVCEEEPKKIIDVIKPSPDDLCQPTYLPDGSILYKGGMCLELAKDYLWHVVKRTKPGGFFDRYTGECGAEARYEAATGLAPGSCTSDSGDARPQYKGGLCPTACQNFLWGVATPENDITPPRTCK